jgi:CDP-diacylglycerol---glycerol-3-phosphate 3-phosphatidyltransferase
VSCELASGNRVITKMGNRNENATSSRPGARDGMNLPNKLTISRFLLTVAFLVVMFSQVRYHTTIALALFIAAAVSDYLDGELARRHKLITNFGILMDPLADKIMVCSAFIAFVGLNWIPAWMVVIVVARELAITGLRLLAAAKNVVLAAEGYGKQKTISQIVAIIAIFVLASYNDWGFVGRALFGFPFPGQTPWVEWFTELAKWVAVALTFISGWLYLWRNRAIYLQDL